MKKLIILFLFLAGCADENPAKNGESENIVINHGYLNKNITSIRGTMEAKEYEVNQVKVRPHIEVDLKNLKLNAEMISYLHVGTFCKINSSLTANNYFAFKNTLDRMQVCSNSNKRIPCIMWSSYTPSNDFKLYSPVGYEAEANGYPFNCSSKLFACAYSTSEELTAVLDPIITAELSNCN